MHAFVENCIDTPVSTVLALALDEKKWSPISVGSLQDVASSLVVLVCPSYQKEWKERILGYHIQRCPVCPWQSFTRCSIKVLRLICSDCGVISCEGTTLCFRWMPHWGPDDYILSIIGRAEAAIIAAVLHDVVDDTETKMEELKAAFGPEVSSLVQQVSQLSSMVQLLRRRRRTMVRRMWSNNIHLSMIPFNDGCSWFLFQDARRASLWWSVGQALLDLSSAAGLLWQRNLVGKTKKVGFQVVLASLKEALTE